MFQGGLQRRGLGGKMKNENNGKRKKTEGNPSFLSAIAGVTVSLVLEDWELARVALSCHMALDSLCQVMHEAG